MHRQRRESAEKILGFFQEALADGIHRFVAQLGELLQLGALGGVEAGGHLDIRPHQQVAVAVALHVFDSPAFQSKYGAGLGPRRHFDQGFAGERGHLDLRAQGGLHKADGHLAIQVVALALEDFMLLDMDDDGQVSRVAPADSRFARVHDAQAGPGIHPGGHPDFHLGGALAPPGAMAALARFFQ